MQAHPGGALPAQVLIHPPDYRCAIRYRGASCCSKEPRLHQRKEEWIVRHLSAEHHAVNVRQMTRDVVYGADTTIDYQRQLGEIRLQPVDDRMIQRWNLKIVPGRQPPQDSLARVHDKRFATRASHRPDEIREKAIAVVIVDADPRLDGHRYWHYFAHRMHAARDQRSIGHQTGAEAAGLHPMARTTDIKVHLVVTEVRSNACGLRQQRRVMTGQLDRDRMFHFIKRQQPVAIATHDRLGREHLRIQPDVRGELSQEITAMPVRHLHHRGNGNLRNSSGGVHLCIPGRRGMLAQDTAKGQACEASPVTATA